MQDRVNDFSDRVAGIGSKEYDPVLHEDRSGLPLRALRLGTEFAAHDGAIKLTA